MSYLKIFGFVMVYVMCISRFAYGDTCVPKGPCLCIFPNGTGIDLSPLDGNTFYTADTYSPKMNSTQYEMTTFFYHPCYDVKINTTLPADVNTCTKPLSICRHVNKLVQVNGTTTYKFNETRYDFLGESKYSNLSDQGNSITYPNGPSETIVLLECTQSDSTLQIYSLADPDRIVLAFYSSHACLKQIEEPGRSVGSTLLIIFFSFLIFYLILGICTKKFLMGATGIEVVPNLGFWSELPNLVKDGWMFMMSGFKLPPRGAGPTVSPDPNSYDSI